VPQLTGNQVKVRVILRPTASRPVSRGIKPPTGIANSFLFLFKGNYLKMFSVLYIMGLPLWWEGASAIFSAVTPQWEPHRTRNQILVPHSRLRSPYLYPPGTGWSLRLTAEGIRCSDHATPSTRKSRHYFAGSGGRNRVRYYCSHLLACCTRSGS
jgi:hypothetical protein